MFALIVIVGIVVLIVGSILWVELVDCEFDSDYDGYYSAGESYNSGSSIYQNETFFGEYIGKSEVKKTALIIQIFGVLPDILKKR